MVLRYSKKSIIYLFISIYVGIQWSMYIALYSHTKSKISLNANVSKHIMNGMYWYINYNYWCFACVCISYPLSVLHFLPSNSDVSWVSSTRRSLQILLSILYYFSWDFCRELTIMCNIRKMGFKLTIQLYTTYWPKNRGSQSYPMIAQIWL